MTTTRGLVRRTTRKNRTHVDYQLLHSGKSGKEVDVDLAGDEDMNMKVNVNIDRIKGGKISKKRSSLPQRVDTSVTNSTGKVYGIINEWIVYIGDFLFYLKYY